MFNRIAICVDIIFFIVLTILAAINWLLEDPVWQTVSCAGIGACTLWDAIMRIFDRGFYK